MLPPLSEVLIPIWQRVLRRSQVGVNDNFFDLGGDSSSALEIFAEIAQVCGRYLPPTTILQTPTIAGLAALLEGTNSPRFAPLIQMRAGTERPAVFVTHGIGGSVLELAQLLRHIQTDHPIYGLQARGIDGVDEPYDRVEDIAQSFLDAIREMQPLGPYIFIGYSMGGLVTLDMARRLSESGEKNRLTGDDRVLSCQTISTNEPAHAHLFPPVEKALYRMSGNCLYEMRYPTFFARLNESSVCLKTTLKPHRSDFRFTSLKQSNAHAPLVIRRSLTTSRAFTLARLIL